MTRAATIELLKLIENDLYQTEQLDHLAGHYADAGVLDRARHDIACVIHHIDEYYDNYGSTK